MSVARRSLVAILAATAILAAAPARSEFVDVDYGPHRYVTGTMLKNGVRVNFFGFTSTGFRATSYQGDPRAEPYVEQTWGHVEVIKGTARSEVFGPFRVTFDPALGSARITGTLGGVSIDVTLAALGAAPAYYVYVPGPSGIQPPTYIDLSAGVEAGRPAAAAGSASAAGVGSISGGAGSGEIRAGFGGGISYWDF